jgi:hypothetical protein
VDSGRTGAMNGLRSPMLRREQTQHYAPGDFLSCEYTIDMPAAARLNAFEASVVWITSGKGDEDIGVHFFERHLTKSVSDDFLNQPHRLSTVLPMSPSSYSGRIVKILWFVRVRLFLEDGTQITEDCPFRLGWAGLCESTEAADCDA